MQQIASSPSNQQSQQQTATPTSSSSVVTTTNTTAIPIGNSCAGCREPIRDKFIFSVIDLYWHQDCVQCSDCSLKLSERCYTFDGKLYCRSDYWRRFGPKCFACRESIERSELVQRIEGNRVYHLKCFTCDDCRKQLKAGEQLHLIDGERLLCKQDYNHHQLTAASGALIKSAGSGSNFEPQQRRQPAGFYQGPAKQQFQGEHYQGGPQTLLTVIHDPTGRSLLTGQAPGQAQPAPSPAASGEPLDRYADPTGMFGAATSQPSGRVHSPLLSLSGVVDAVSEPSHLRTAPPLGPARPLAGRLTCPPLAGSASKRQPGGRLGARPNVRAGGPTKARSRLATSAMDKSFPADGNGRQVSLGGANQSNQNQQQQQQLTTSTGRIDGRRGPKRPRTILTTSQRRAFKNSFDLSQKPCRKVREALAKETGLSVRIVQVWFQNQRAKLKKIQRKQMPQVHSTIHSQSSSTSPSSTGAHLASQQQQQQQQQQQLHMQVSGSGALSQHQLSAYHAHHAPHPHQVHQPMRDQHPDRQRQAGVYQQLPHQPMPGRVNGVSFAADALVSAAGTGALPAAARQKRPLGQRQASRKGARLRKAGELSEADSVSRSVSELEEESDVEADSDDVDEEDDIDEEDDDDDDDDVDDEDDDLEEEDDEDDDDDDDDQMEEDQMDSRAALNGQVFDAIKEEQVQTSEQATKSNVKTTDQNTFDCPAYEDDRRQDNLLGQGSADKLDESNVLMCQMKSPAECGSEAGEKDECSYHCCSSGVTV